MRQRAEHEKHDVREHTQSARLNSTTEAVSRQEILLSDEKHGSQEHDIFSNVVLLHVRGVD